MSEVKIEQLDRDLTTLNTCSAKWVKYEVKTPRYKDENGEYQSWLEITFNGHHFGSWPLLTGSLVLQALAANALALKYGSDGK